MSWTAQQRRVIDQPAVEFMGTDARGRPVVRYADRTNKLTTKQSWAVTRAGEPTDIVEPVEKEDD